MAPNLIRQRWHSGAAAVGTFVFSSDPATSEIAARAGFDFVVVDLEHTTLDVAGAAQQVRAAVGAGIAALARVPDSGVGLIAPLLDSGAHGILLPHYGRDADAARAFAHALRYAPLGERGSCSGVRASAYGLADHADTVRDANADVIGIGLVEDAASISRLDALLQEAPVDAVMPGPGDLATSMGVPGRPTHPIVKQAVSDILLAARRAGVRAGMYLNSPGEIRSWLPLKLDFYVYLIDTKVLALAYAAAIVEMRGVLEAIAESP